MKEIKTEDAIGSVLCHDITEIVKDQRKGPRFKKGHIIKEEDIEVLLNLGKEHLYVFEKDETMMHENDAAEILCNLCFNEYMKKSAISEGKIELTSTIDGLFKVNREELFKVNSFGQMMIATRQGNVPVKKGDKLAGMRIIPLVIEKEKMQQIQEIVQKPILKIMPYQIKTAGIITTGSEVYKGRIKDTFTPVIVEKLKEYGVEVTYHSLSLDDHEMTTSKINEALKQGVDLVLCTGGLSVDPDDKTPLAIKNTGAKIISYAAPDLPGPGDPVRHGHRVAAGGAGAVRRRQLPGGSADLAGPAAGGASAGRLHHAGRPARRYPVADAGVSADLRPGPKRP